VCGSQSGVEVRAWPGLALLRRVETDLAHVHDLSFSPDGTRLALVGGRPAEAGTLEVRSWPAGALVCTDTPRSDLLYAVAWSPDSRALVCAGHEPEVSVHDAADGRVRVTLLGHSRPVLCAAYAPSGEWIVTAGVDRSLRVFETDTGTCTRVLDNHTAPVRDIAFRPAPAGDPAPAQLASVGDDGTVRLWQPGIGRLLRFARVEERPLSAAWTPDGRRLLVACSDGRVRAIDPEEVEVVATLPALEGWAYSVRVSPSGDAAVAGGDGGEVAVVELSP
jgi:WD40 repeat protein